MIQVDSIGWAFDPDNAVSLKDIGSSVTKKTDFLVTGADVGSKKIGAAKEKGVTVIGEDEYLAMIKAD